MRINYNPPAAIANTAYAKNNNAAAKSMQKLATGLQINTAADDASGLAISEKMRSQIRGLDQASVNAQDGISLIQDAEGNLGEVEDILQRMRELAVKSANDTKVTSDRGEIQKEFNQLTNEINRIGNTTEFNTQKLLNGGGTETSYDTTSLKTGANAGKMANVYRATKPVTEQLGKYDVSIRGAGAAGKVITIDDQSFKLSTASTVTAIAADLMQQVNNNNKLKDRYDFSVTKGTLTFTEKQGKATGNALVLAGTSVSSKQQASSHAEVQGVYVYSLNQAFEKAGAKIQVGGFTAIEAQNTKDPAAGQFAINDNATEQAKSIVAAFNSVASISAKFDVTVDGTNIIFTQKAGKGIAGTGTASLTGAPTLTGNTATKGEDLLEINTLAKAGGKFTIGGQDIAVVNDKTDKRLATGEAILASDNIKTQSDRLKNAINSNTVLNARYTATTLGDKVKLTQVTGYESMKTGSASSKTTQTDGFEAKLQIGANSYQSMTVKIDDMRADKLGVTSKTETGGAVTSSKGTVAHYTAEMSVNNGTDDTNVEYALDITSFDKATAAIDVIDDAIAKVSSERSRLGAYQNRLDHTISNLGTTSENMAEAESRIRDTDMAKEMMTFQKNSVLSQAAQSMLAQANQLPQGVLQLLK